MEPYQLKTDIFEGPLELLLTLIERRKLFINDISLAAVTDDYLKYLEQHPDFPVAETAQFVLVGSTLLLIKSKSLLPVLSLTQEEQESMVDLETRLKQLEVFRTLARGLATQYDQARLYGRMRRRAPEVVFSPDPSMQVPVFAAAMEAVIAHLPKGLAKLPEATVRKVVSIDDMMRTLSERISSSMSLSFREASRDVGHKMNVIVTFLAMLELVRQGVVRVEQHAQYGDITMHQDSVGTPRYG